MQKLMAQMPVCFVIASVIVLGTACGDDANSPPIPLNDSGGDGNSLDGAPVGDSALDAKTDGLVNLDASDTSAPTVYSHLFNGAVNALVHNGTSWYVGGGFYGANVAPAPRLLPLDASGKVVNSCVLQGGFDGEVLAVAQSGASTYVGGLFTRYQGNSANGVAKIDSSTCALDTTFSPPNANGFDGGVRALAVAGTSLYVGGQFGMYKGVVDSAHFLAKLDLTSGAIDTTFSPVGPTANGFDADVVALAVNGTALYVGGLFTDYKGIVSSANGLAKLDLTSGVIDTTFSPAGANANGFNGPVLALASAGTSLYAGGAFTRYHNVANSANRLAKLDLTSGAIDTTFSPPGATTNGFSGIGNSVVRALAASGTSLYVGGGFNAYKGVANSANHLAKLDLTSGAIDTTFSPVGPTANGVASNQNGNVFALAVSGSSLFVGGQFNDYRGAAGSAHNFAKVDATTGVQDTAFVPAGNTVNGFERAVFSIGIAGTTIWVGGNFWTYAGYSANAIAKLDDATYALDTAFSPVNKNGFNGEVLALVAANGSIYAGGVFGEYQGVAQSASNLAKLDLTTGVLDTTFSPTGAGTNGFDAGVNALATAGTSLYVGGAFTRYKNVLDSANRLAKLDLTSGALDTTFSPPGVGANGVNVEVFALATSNTSLYVGGDFTRYRGTPNSASRLAKLDLTTGAIDTTFSPVGVNANGFDATVESFAVAGNVLYVGGAFVNYKGVAGSANSLAKLDATTGAIDTTFSPVGATSNGFDADVLALAVSGNNLYVGGAFNNYKGVGSSANSIAKLDTTSGAIDTTFSPVGALTNGFDNDVHAITISGTSLFTGGLFHNYRGSSYADSIAILTTTSGALQ